MVGLKHVYTQKIHRDGISCVRFAAHSNDVVFTVSQDTLLKVHTLSEQQQLHSVNICDLTLSCCCPLDDKTVIIGSWDNNIYFYSIEFGRTMDTWMGMFCRSGGGKRQQDLGEEDDHGIVD